MHIKYYIVIKILLTLICFINCDEVVVTVNTNNGQVKGRKEMLDENSSVNVFLGIPYAQPPIGRLRFKKPEPVKSWSKPINATEWPNPCIQSPLLNTYQNTNFSEDCLYLNIWSPISPYYGSHYTHRKAVMFWIHGGGLLVGSSNEYQFNGKILSTKGDVVVVSINYRLGALGFFYTETNDTPGNMGLWDMVLAIKWVRNNIAYFGGDPNRITIFGQSGGSWAVSALILSPISRALFSRAVLISGALISIEIANKTTAKENWLKAAKIIGCANQNDYQFNSAIIDCMRNANTSALANVVFSSDLVGNMAAVLPVVTIDDSFLPNSPIEMFKTGNYGSNIDLMIGNVENEGQGSLAFYLPNYDTNPTSALTHFQAYNDLKNVTNRTPFINSVDANKASELYFAEISKQSKDYDLLRRTVGIAYGDIVIGCQTMYFAQSYFIRDYHDNSVGHNVYQYYYVSHFGANQSVYGCIDWQGTCHGSDLTPLFGLPFFRSEVSSDAQKQESERVIDFYSHFATHGYPSAQNGIEWPKYYRLNGHLVTPYYVLNNSYNSSNSYYSYGLKITECEYLWKKYIYVKL